MSDAPKVGGKVSDPKHVDKAKLGWTQATQDKSKAGGQAAYVGLFFCWNCGALCRCIEDTNYYVNVRCWSCGAVNTVG